MTNSLGGSLATATVTVGSISPSQQRLLANAVHVRLSALSARKLLKLCVSVGGNACGKMSRQEQVKLIDARVKLLSGKTLLGLCVSVGGSCGTIVRQPPGGPKAPPSSQADAGNRSGQSRGYCSVARPDNERCLTFSEMMRMRTRAGSRTGARSDLSVDGLMIIQLHMGEAR